MRDASSTPTRRPRRGQDNAPTISPTDVASAKEASGNFDGTGAHHFGGKRKISGGSITLER